MIAQHHASHRNEFLGLGPSRGVAPKNENRPRFRIAGQVGEMFADGDGFAKNSDRVAKLLIRPCVARQFLLLGPNSAVAHKDVG